MRLEIADSLSKKALGIMFKKRMDYLLLFPLGYETRFGASIHSFFCPYFDVMWLDEKKKVVDFRENVRPWTLNITPKMACHYILEAPPRYIRKNRISIGKTVKITG